MNTELEEEFFNTGFIVAKTCSTELLSKLEQRVREIIADFEPTTASSSLEKLHHHIDNTRVNDLRLRVFNELNSDENFREDYFTLGHEYIEYFCGTELAANTKVNFSIQLPHDTTSKLPTHCDTFSGESSYQINLWVPLTDCYGSNSMHIFNPNTTQKVLASIQKYELEGLNKIFEEYQPNQDYIELEVKKGEVVIFTPTTLHGNRLNETDTTRISFNCRFKNLHAPYNAPDGSSKVLGQFYSTLSEKIATKIGRERSLANLIEPR